MRDFNEFADMMPHRIKVQEKTGVGDYGKDSYSSTEKEYMCLLDENTNPIRTTFGEDIVYGLVAYVYAVPIDGDSPVPIGEEAKVTFDPAPSGQPSTRPISKIEKAYWKDGTLHNMTLYFS